LLGYQVSIDLFGCDPSVLDAPADIEAAVRALAAGISATVLEVSTHRYAPQGLSCIAQISASHIAIHTWPENRFAAVDVFSCATPISAAALTGLLRAAFSPGEVACTELPRGAGLRSPFFHESEA
jgi:S-adenosylmethionine decarboxylase proenzyme